MASNKTRTQLKAYFETGDKPSQQDFADLIESNVNLTDDTTITGDLIINDGNATAAGAGVSGAASNTWYVGLIQV